MPCDRDIEAAFTPGSKGSQGWDKDSMIWTLQEGRCLPQVDRISHSTQRLATLVAAYLALATAMLSPWWRFGVTLLQWLDSRTDLISLLHILWPTSKVMRAISSGTVSHLDPLGGASLALDTVASLSLISAHCCIKELDFLL